jgi:hypothetical protein
VPVPLVVPLALASVVVLALPAELLPIVAPVLEVPELPVPPPFMLVPLSVSFMLALPVLPVGAPIVPPEPVGSAVPPALLASDSVPSALVGVLVPFSLPPQLLNERLPSNKATRGKKEVECRMETRSEG